MIVKLLFSQEIYPKKVVINKDTLILVTLTQLANVNVTFERLKEYKQCSLILQDKVLLLSETVKEYELVDSLRVVELENYKEIKLMCKQSLDSSKIDNQKIIKQNILLIKSGSI